MIVTDPTSQAFFERMYVRDPDPWDFRTNPYERSRYDALIGALGGKHYARAFEPGCSIGVFTERLAPLCDELLAIDLSPTACAHARSRCAHLHNVHIAQGSVVNSQPGMLDLLVLSEIGYYFQPSDLRAWCGRLLAYVRQGGTFLSCHWLGTSADHILPGHAVQEILHDLANELHYKLITSHETDAYHLACWERS